MQSEAAGAVGDEFGFAVEDGSAAVRVGFGDENFDTAKFGVGKRVAVGNLDVGVAGRGTVAVTRKVEVEAVLVRGAEDINRTFGWGRVVIDEDFGDLVGDGVGKADREVVVGELAVEVGCQDGKIVGENTVRTGGLDGEVGGGVMRLDQMLVNGVSRKELIGGLEGLSGTSAGQECGCDGKADTGDGTDTMDS